MTVFVSAPSKQRSDAHLTEEPPPIAHWALWWPGQSPPTRGICGAVFVPGAGPVSSSTHQLCVLCVGLRGGTA